MKPLKNNNLKTKQTKIPKKVFVKEKLNMTRVKRYSIKNLESSDKKNTNKKMVDNYEFKIQKITNDALEWLNTQNIKVKKTSVGYYIINENIFSLSKFLIFVNRKRIEKKLQPFLLEIE